VAVNLLLLVAAVYLPGLSDLLGTEPLTAAELGVAAAVALVPAALLAAAQRARRSPAR
jgi:Ca2+-transporting ATPase